MLGGGSNLLVGDGGFDGTVVRGRDPRRRAEDVAACSGAVVHGGRRRGLGRVRRAHRGAGWSGLEALSGIPGSVGATPDPERRRVRGGGRPDTSPTVRTLRPHAPAPCGTLFAGRVRLRLPHARASRPSPAATSIARGHVPAPARRRCRRRSATPSWPARSASRSGRGAPAAGGPGGGAGAARPQGHGARRRRPRHLERRARSSPTPCSTPAAAERAARRPRPASRSPTAGEDQRGLADRARRVRARLRRRPGPAVHQAHPGAHQPRTARARPTCWRWPGRSGPGCSRAFGVTSSWSPSRSARRLRAVTARTGRYLAQTLPLDRPRA